MTQYGTTRDNACTMMQVDEWGFPEDFIVDNALDSISDLNNPDNPLDDYTTIPEELALWAPDETYYESITAIAFSSPLGSHVWALKAYQDFEINPFEGYSINLWELLKNCGEQWDAPPEGGYVIVECTPVMYEKGFMKAPTPIIPFVVDTFTPPSNIGNIEALINARVHAILRSIKFKGCVRLVDDGTDDNPDWALEDTPPGQIVNGLRIYHTGKPCNILEANTADDIYVLISQGGNIDWLPVTTCDQL